MEEQNLNEYHVRLQKLKLLREAGWNPYVDRYERTHTAMEALAQSEKSKLREVSNIVVKPTKNSRNMR